MLTLTIGGQELFDEGAMRFITPKQRTIRLEHSLRSISRWESKWNVEFLSNDKVKTREQSVYYYWCMEITGSVPEEEFLYLTPAQEKLIEEYINSSMTATTITRRGPKKPPSRKIVTSEVIYFWMLQYGIPFDCDKWPLNRLLTLIEVCNVEGGPQQKMGMREQMAQQRALNASRKSKYKTRG